jgi:hypothetical protein
MRPAVSSSSGSGLDTWVVIGEEGIVTGLRRGDSLAEDPDTFEEDVMELGQRPIRPSTRVETLLGKRSSQGVTSWLPRTACCSGFLLATTPNARSRSWRRRRRARSADGGR